MAGTLTHAYFSLDLYDKLSIRSKELLLDYKEQLKTFSESNDPLFLYNIANLRKGKKIRDFAYYFHRYKSYEFFSTLINYIKYNGYIYNSSVIAYLYGTLSHYVLDTNMHPFIIYKTGYFDRDNKESYKYNMVHEELETYIDNYLVSIREKIKPNKFKCYNFCFNVEKLDKDLIEVIDFTYKEVYGIDNFHKYYLDSIKQAKKFYKKYRYDRFGFKKGFYKVFDKLSPKSSLRTVPLSYKVKNMKEYLNLDNKTWYNPTDKRIRSDKSFIEIYTKSLDKCFNMIDEINKFFYYDKKINLKKVIDNLSYVDGRDCSKKKELKYFEF